VLVDLGGGGIDLAGDELEDGALAGELEFTAAAGGRGEGEAWDGEVSGVEAREADGAADLGEDAVDGLDGFGMPSTVGFKLLDHLGEVTVV